MDARRFCPIYRFDKRATTFPVSIEWFAARSQEYKNGLPQPVNRIRRNTTMEPDARFFPVPDEEAPVYVHQYDWDEKTVAFCYVLFYMVNPGYRIMGSDFGSFHTGDVEHVTVLVDRSSEMPLRVFFAAHSQAQGQWRDVPDCEMVDGGRRPVAYVARGSHASYPKRGTWHRIFGCANDVADGLGWMWDPSDRVLPVNEQDDRMYAYYGEVDGPARQDWFVREGLKSSTWWQRFFATFACCS